MFITYRELMRGYLNHLRDRSGYSRSVRVASQWILDQTETPTRDVIIRRHLEKGHGDFMPGAVQANKELALQRAAFRWGLYHNVWNGGDPTVGIKKWKTKHRKRIAKFLEIRSILSLFEFARTEKELRDRALYGIALFTGCRPVEVRTAIMGCIAPYGTGGCWTKGKTKNGEDHEIPLPSQAMEWLHAWLEVRRSIAHYQDSPWIFPGGDPAEPLSCSAVRSQWSSMMKSLNITGLWNYDLRRTLASYLINELGYADKKIQAILNHYDGRALSHYCHVSFDALVPVMQHYANWLFHIKGEPHGTHSHVPASTHDPSLQRIPSVV